MSWIWLLIVSETDLNERTRFFGLHKCTKELGPPSFSSSKEYLAVRVEFCGGPEEALNLKVWAAVLKTPARSSYD